MQFLPPQPTQKKSEPARYKRRAGFNFMSEITNIADHAAQQSDRWLFIALLILFILASVVLWRWMVNDREKMEQRLSAMTERHIEGQQKLVEVVTKNTEVVANNTRVLSDVGTTLAYCKTRNER